MIKNLNRNSGTPLVPFLYLIAVCLTLTQCSKSSDNNVGTQPLGSGQAAFSVQNDFTDASLSPQHHRAARQADGKIVAAQSDGGVIRIGTDNKPDATFQKLALGTNALISDIVVQPDGKILMSGRFAITGHPNIVRLNSDGSVDNGFTAFATQNAPNALLLRPDGKVIVCGNFSYTQASGMKYHVMRLNVDGSLDNGFVCELGFSDLGATCLALAADSKIIVGGISLGYVKNGQQYRPVVRLNENGSVDATFNFPLQLINPAGTPAIQTMALDKDGKLLIGGAFYSIGQSATDKTDYNSIARLNTDGSLDKTFLSPNAGSDFVNAIQPLSNGNILVGRRLKTLSVDIPDFFTVLNSKGEASDFRLGFPRGGIDDIVQESTTNFALVGAFKPAAGGQYGLIRIVQK